MGAIGPISIKIGVYIISLNYRTFVWAKCNNGSIKIRLGTHIKIYLKLICTFRHMNSYR